MSTTVQLGNQAFHYNNTNADHDRRVQYFKHQSGAVLDPSEQEILTALGIDKATEDSLAPYLAEFFRLLPQCSSPASLLLNKRCELPYYVLWSVMFANNQVTQQRLAKQGPVPSDINIVRASSIIQELTPFVPPSFVTPGSATERLSAGDRAIQEIFTLILPSAPELITQEDDIRRVFTLIQV